MTRIGWAIGILLPAGIASLPCAAKEPQEPATVTDTPARDDSLIRTAVTDRAAITHAHRDTGAEWGTGAFSLAAIRLKEGRKRNYSDGGTGEAWHRSYGAKAHVEQDVAGGWNAFADGSLSRTKSGGTDFALYSRRSTAYDSEVAVGIKRDDGTFLSVSAFDRGGWQGGDIAEFANRTANGEARARSGVAAEFGVMHPDRTSAVTLRMEQARTPGLGNDRTVALSTRVRF